MSSKRETGARYESIAAGFLRLNGYDILERNYRSRTGEIDIIAFDKNYLCFVEVKYRSSLVSGYPSEAVDHRKQMKIINTSKHYIVSHGMRDPLVRYDIVEIVGNRIRILKNSFGGF